MTRGAQDDKGDAEDDEGALRRTYVSPVILRPQAEESVPNSAPSSGGVRRHLPPSGGRFWGRPGPGYGTGQAAKADRGPGAKPACNFGRRGGIG